MNQNATNQNEPESSCGASGDAPPNRKLQRHITRRMQCSRHSEEWALVVKHRADHRTRESRNTREKRDAARRKNFFAEAGRGAQQSWRGITACGRRAFREKITVFPGRRAAAWRRGAAVTLAGKQILMPARSFSSEEDDDFPAETIQGLDEPGAFPSDAGRDGGSGVGSGGDADAGPGFEPQPDGETYWALSRTPLTSLAFTLPLVLAYEGGVLLLGRGSPRNGADVWLRQALDALGFSDYFLLPVLTIVGLLAWHHVQHDRWRFSPAVLVGMCVECLVLAAVLVGLARLQSRIWPLALGDGAAALLGRFVGYCGAGLYEEVLFRLLMLPAVAWVFRQFAPTRAAAGAWAVVATSVVFAAAHYVGPLGDTFDLHSFAFRTLAGIFFATLFIVRGFGIAAGTHAAYDMIVGLF